MARSVHIDRKIDFSNLACLPIKLTNQSCGAVAYIIHIFILARSHSKNFLFSILDPCNFLIAITNWLLRQINGITNDWINYNKLKINRPHGDCLMKAIFSYYDFFFSSLPFFASNQKEMDRHGGEKQNVQWWFDVINSFANENKNERNSE